MPRSRGRSESGSSRSRSRGRSPSRSRSPTDNRRDRRRSVTPLRSDDERETQRLKHLRDKRRQGRSRSRSRSHSHGVKPKEAKESKQPVEVKAVKREKEEKRSPSRSRSRGHRASSRKGKRRPSPSSGSSASRSSSSSRSRSASSDRKAKGSHKKRAKESKADRKARKEAEKEAKRAAKRAEKKKAKKDSVAAVLGYTNEDNPFGDPNLSEQFVWGKKFQRELADRKIASVPSATVQSASRSAHVEELLKVRARREQYEKEREERENKRIEDQRAREAELFGDWKEKEEEFHRIQSKRRSALRIQGGREKPIDVLAKNILLLQSGGDDGTLSSMRTGDDIVDHTSMDVELTEPHRILEGLPLTELRELEKEIATYSEMETNKDFVEYWKCLARLCAHEIESAEEEEAASAVKGAEGRRIRQLHVAVMGDVVKMFDGKNTRELEAMQRKIEDNAKATGRHVDSEYWQGVLRAFNVYLSRSKLRDIHLRMLEASVRKLDERKAALRRVKAAASATAPATAHDAGNGDETDSDVDGTLSPTVFVEENDRAESPPLLPEGAEGVDTIADNIKRLEAKREAILAAQRRAASGEAIVTDDEVARRKQALLSAGAPVSAEEAAVEEAKLKVRLEAEGGFENMEDDLLGDYELPSETYLWQDKYRPRKPRYLNRVKTGYDWNKYNQTHYDHDNPPPKTVQGYKFNVFYPDLIDKSVAPKYYLEPTDSPEFVIIRFHAGPPYEDLAFKIVNREWNVDKRHGFRCQFDRGILQLYFNFKRHFYRR